jgi:gluconokinase
MIVVVMGVSGCGKTTVGRLLAQRLGWIFHEGDEFHSAANIAKMSEGTPLTDGDRWPWLAAIKQEIGRCIASGSNAVIACSALRGTYRSYLAAGVPELRFVYLRGDAPTILDRMKSRESHYMKSGMLDSQIASLEEPSDAIDVDIRNSPDAIVTHIETQLERRQISR